VQGIMQAGPLTLDVIFRRAETLWPSKQLLTATPSGVEWGAYGPWAQRTRRLGTVLDELGVSADGRVATFGWNTARHLELYFAAPCTGRVLHTLNIRLFADQLTYIANHAEDEVIFCDRSLLPLLWPHIDKCKTVRHVVVMDDTVGSIVPELPDDARLLDYEPLSRSPSRTRSSASLTRTGPRRCATRAVRPAIRRALFTLIARLCCTRSPSAWLTSWV
jgi:fatty-acyl-CoA synthase